MRLNYPVDCTIINASCNSNKYSGISLYWLWTVRSGIVNVIQCLQGNLPYQYDHSLVTNNICFSNQQAGIQAEAGRSNTFIRNNCTDNGGATITWAGIIYKNANQGIFRLNQSIGSGGSGISLELACTNVIATSNVCANNGEYGVKFGVTTVAYCSLLYNSITNNTSHGFMSWGITTFLKGIPWNPIITACTFIIQAPVLMW